MEGGLSGLDSCQILAVVVAILEAEWRCVARRVGVLRSKEGEDQ